MAILRSDFPATPQWRAADLRHELSRLHTVLVRTDGARSANIQTVINAKVQDLTALVGTDTSTSAQLASAVLVEATVANTLSGVTAGSLTISIDGVEETLTGLNFTGVTTLAQIAAVIDAALVGGTVSSDADQIFFTSNSTGKASTITATSDPAVGTYIGVTIGTDASSSPTITQGTGFPAEAVGAQLGVYPEYRDFDRKYRMAVQFAQAHLTPSAVLTAIGAQLQYFMEQLGWAYA